MFVVLITVLETSDAEADNVDVRICYTLCNL